MKCKCGVIGIVGTCEKCLKTHLLKIFLECCSGGSEFFKRIHVLFFICEFAEREEVFSLGNETVIALYPLFESAQCLLDLCCFLNIVPEIRLLHAVLVLTDLVRNTVNMKSILKICYRAFVRFKFESYVVKFKH